MSSAMERFDAYAEAGALVCEAVAHQRAHAAARAMTAEERQAHPETWRLPELDLRDWYQRAGRVVDVLESDGNPYRTDPGRLCIRCLRPRRPWRDVPACSCDGGPQ